MEKAYLSVIIATHRPDGLAKVADMHLPEIPGVEYVVSWQEREGAPIVAKIASRPDIKVVDYEGHTLSGNRNNALRHASGEVVLIADNDITLYTEAMVKLMEIFKSRPYLHYASLRYDSPVKKKYPLQEISLAKPPRHFQQASIEIAFRRCPATRTLLFNEEFGLGAAVFGAGEDSLFLLVARNLGLNCRFFPLTIASHPALSTGYRAPSPKVIRSKGALIALKRPVGFILRLPLEAWRYSKRGHASFLPSLFHLFSGALRALASPSIRHYVKHGLQPLP